MIKFYRGPKKSYNVIDHGEGIYFATDTKEIIHNGLSFLGNIPSELQEIIDKVNANENALEILNGTGEGSVQKQVNDAIDNFANQLTDDGIVNTFKELVDYAATNAGDLGSLILRVNDAEVKNEEQDELILNLQTDLNVFKGEVEMKLTDNSVELEEKMDDKITTALSWENVQ